MMEVVRRKLASFTVGVNLEKAGDIRFLIASFVMIHFVLKYWPDVTITLVCKDIPSFLGSVVKAFGTYAPDASKLLQVLVDEDHELVDGNDLLNNRAVNVVADGSWPAFQDSVVDAIVQFPDDNHLAMFINPAGHKKELDMGIAWFGGLQLYSGPLHHWLGEVESRSRNGRLAIGFDVCFFDRLWLLFDRRTRRLFPAPRYEKVVGFGSSRDWLTFSLRPVFVFPSDAESSSGVPLRFLHFPTTHGVVSFLKGFEAAASWNDFEVEVQRFGGSGVAARVYVSDSFDCPPNEFLPVIGLVGVREQLGELPVDQLRDGENWDELWGTVVRSADLSSVKLPREVAKELEEASAKSCDCDDMEFGEVIGEKRVRNSIQAAFEVAKKCGVALESIRERSNDLFEIARCARARHNFQVSDLEPIYMLGAVVDRIGLEATAREFFGALYAASVGVAKATAS